MIDGETFDARPVTYAVVDEADPDSGEPVQLAVFEGCIILGTATEVEATTQQLRDEADAVPV